MYKEVIYWNLNRPFHVFTPGLVIMCLKMVHMMYPPSYPEFQIFLFQFILGVNHNCLKLILMLPRNLV